MTAKCIKIIWFSWLLCLAPTPNVQALDADKIVKDGFNYWRRIPEWRLTGWPVVPWRRS